MIININSSESNQRFLTAERVVPSFFSAGSKVPRLNRDVFPHFRKAIDSKNILFSSSCYGPFVIPRLNLLHHTQKCSIVQFREKILLKNSRNVCLFTLALVWIKGREGFVGYCVMKHPLNDCSELFLGCFSIYQIKHNLMFMFFAFRNAESIVVNF